MRRYVLVVLPRGPAAVTQRIEPLNSKAVASSRLDLVFLCIFLSIPVAFVDPNRCIGLKGGHGRSSVLDLLRWKSLFYLGQGQGLSITIEKGNETNRGILPIDNACVR